MHQEFPFEVWKAYLREDCRQRHQLLISESGDLKIFWSCGVEPTVQAIIEQADSISHLTLPPMPEFSVN
jgi:hypothetical protein